MEIIEIPNNTIFVESKTKYCGEDCQKFIGIFFVDFWQANGQILSLNIGKYHWVFVDG